MIDGRSSPLTSGAIPGAHWTMLDSGWVKLEYAVDPSAQTNAAGVAFDYPEEMMVRKTWLGDGPYRVWRNRLKGATWASGIRLTTTVAGYKDWVFPEFAGYFANVRWLRLTTTEGAADAHDPRRTHLRARRHSQSAPAAIGDADGDDVSAGQPGRRARPSGYGQQVPTRRQPAVRKPTRRLGPRTGITAPSICVSSRRTRNSPS